jgi:hypothetical protein
MSLYVKLLMTCRWTRIRVGMKSQLETPMTTLTSFQNCLERELPLFHWRCEPADQSKLIPETEIPEQIIVTAERDGRQVAGTPRQVNGRILMRWGIETTARLVSKECLDTALGSKIPLEWSWDKLSEY